MSTIASPIIPWVGGKEKLAPSILQVFPQKFDPYVEPFGGGGAILLGLPKSASRLDIYNDFNRDLVNLMVCVKEHPLELIKELEFLPLHSRAEFEDLKALMDHDALTDIETAAMEQELAVAEECFTSQELDEIRELYRRKTELRNVRRAAIFYKISRGSFSGTRSSFGVKRNNIRRFRCQIQKASRRLEDVVIENRDAVSLIQERDSPTALIYCDPPYFKAEGYYDVDFRRKDHVRLYHALKGCKGFVVLSYNDCPYIRNLYKDFFILAFRRDNPLAQKEGSKYGELIITNFDPRPYMSRQLDLFDVPGEKGALDFVRIPKKILKTI